MKLRALDNATSASAFLAGPATAGGGKPATRCSATSEDDSTQGSARR